MANRGDALVLTCEHGGNRVPARYRSLFHGKQSLLQSHRGWDPGTLELGRFLSKRTRVPLFAATVTRLLIDLNRSLTNPRAFSEITRLLSRDEKQRIIARHYQPHRTSIETAIAKRLQDGARVVHLALHSFTPSLDGDERNADIAMLYDPRRRPETKWARDLAAAIRERLPHLRYRMNYPYRGISDGLTTALRRRHSANRYIGIEIEINQRIVFERGEWRAIKSAIARAIQSKLQ